MRKQDFTVLKIKDLYPFPDNPFRVVEDEMLMELAESIREFGMVTPIITRPKEDGNGYEIIAGQRRVRASELAGIDTVPAFVLQLDRDRAIITLVAFLGGLYHFKDVGGIAIGTVLHFLVVPGEILRRITGIHPQGPL